jgi:hypothetical protein
MPACSAMWRTAKDVIVPSGVEVKCEFDNVGWNRTGGIGSLLEQVERSRSVAPVAGTYLLCHKVVYESNPGGTRWSGTYRNGLADHWEPRLAIPRFSTEMMVSYPMVLPKNGFVEWYFWQDSGVTLRAFGEQFVALL